MTQSDEAGGRTIVWLGNRNAVEVVPDEDDSHEQAAAEGRPVRTVRRPIDGPAKNCTTVTVPHGLPLLEAAYDITHAQRGVWQAHSDDPAPAWVASTDPTLAQILAAHWTCELRDPDPDHVASGDADQPGYVQTEATTADEPGTGDA